MDSAPSATQTKKPEGAAASRETITVTDNRSGKTYEIPINATARSAPWTSARSKWTRQNLA